MIIVVDTQEQTPYTFEYYGVTTESRKLKSGDYSVAGYEDQVSVERKTHSDAFGSLGKGRARFKREMIRLSEYRYAAIIIECNLSSFLERPPCSSMNPIAAINSLISFDIKYGVRAIFAGSRGLAEAYTFRLLQKFYSYCVEIEAGKTIDRPRNVK